jgi:hypothetical protein
MLNRYWCGSYTFHDSKIKRYEVPCPLPTKTSVVELRSSCVSVPRLLDPRNEVTAAVAS